MSLIIVPIPLAGFPVAAGDSGVGMSAFEVIGGASDGAGGIPIAVCVAPAAVSGGTSIGVLEAGWWLACSSGVCAPAGNPMSKHISEDETILAAKNAACAGPYLKVKASDMAEFVSFLDSQRNGDRHH